jgi:transposase
MKKLKFTDAQIDFILRQVEEGSSVAEICRKAGNPDSACLTSAPMEQTSWIAKERISVSSSFPSVTKMNQKSETRQTGAAKAIKDILRATRKQYSAEEKIRIVLDGLRGEETIAELCRREGIAQSIY